MMAMMNDDEDERCDVEDDHDHEENIERTLMMARRGTRQTGVGSGKAQLHLLEMADDGE